LLHEKSAYYPAVHVTAAAGAQHFSTTIISTYHPGSLAETFDIAVENGLVSITPLRLDLTDMEELKRASLD